VAGPCEHGNESSGSVKGDEFLKYLCKYYLVKKESPPMFWLVINTIAKMNFKFGKQVSVVYFKGLRKQRISSVRIKDASTKTRN
jgi:hypothetical protein